MKPQAPLQLVDLVARHRRVAEQVEAGVLAVLRGGRYVGGPVVEQAEAAVAGLLGRRFGVGAGSGTDALALALKALGVGPGDEVILPAVSFFATVESVLHTGATPVLVDVRADRPLLDPLAAAAAVTARTRAIVPVHLFGDVAGAPSVGVPVVDDAAQSVGTSPPPRQGVVAAVSFYPTKVLGACGDGGLVATDDAELALRVRRLGSHGMSANNVHHRVAGHVGGNSRLDAVQAAVLLGHLAALEERVSRRRAVAARLDAVVGRLALERDPGSPVSVYVIRHPARDRLQAELLALGVHSAVYYPMPMSAQEVVGGDADRARGGTPHAAAFCAEALALPCHEDLSEGDLERLELAICSALASCS